MESETQPFLDASCKNELLSDHACFYQKEKAYHRFWHWISSVAISGLVLSTFFGTYIYAYTKPAAKCPSLFSWMAEGVQYEVDTPSQDYWNNQLYMGEPSYEGDYAWNDLLSYMGLSLSGEEADQARLSAAHVAKDRQATILGVFHNLHCLRRIRQYMRNDYYYPNRTEEERLVDLEHTIHCMEAMRTSIMCHPDLTIHPLIWGGEGDHPLLASPHVPRECMNWDKILKWIKPRIYVQSDIDMQLVEEDKAPAFSKPSPN